MENSVKVEEGAAEPFEFELKLYIYNGDQKPTVIVLMWVPNVAWQIFAVLRFQIK
jgi:hypothetical protein